MIEISYLIGLFTIIIPLLLLTSVAINPIFSQEDDQPIEPIPPANITNQTSSQISIEIVAPAIIH